MIGYDLDGVIISDILHKWTNEDVSKDLQIIFSIREKLAPQFVPEGDFVIITGRPIIDKKMTVSWLKTHNIKYKKLHMCNFKKKYNEDMIIRHKAKWINSYPHMKFFVESDKKQTEEIQKFVKIRVYNFSDFINENLKNRKV